MTKVLGGYGGRVSGEFRPSGRVSMGVGEYQGLN